MTDRKIVYAGSGVQDIDIMLPQNWSRRAMNYFARAVFGPFGAVLNFSPLSVSGFNLTLSDGALFGPIRDEDTAMGSLPDENYTTVPIACNPANTTVGPFAVPTVGGQSVNHLVWARFATADTDNEVLFYQDAANPDITWRGVGNDGQPQPTTRREYVEIGITAGTPAATGSQVTPTVASGQLPLHIVTLATGADSLTLGNVALHPLCPLQFTNLQDLRSGFSTMVPFAASQNWTVPYFCKRIRVRVWGAGGGGGGASAAGNAGQGGSGGGFAEGVFAVVPGSVLAITVGAGGSAGTSSGTAGGSGGGSAAGGLCSATGGSGGGSLNTVVAVAAGNGTGGQLNLPGSYGVLGAFLTPNWYGGPGGGAGGPGGGNGSSLNTGNTAANGLFPGGGANGAAGGNFNGGQGSNGYVEIWY